MENDSSFISFPSASRLLFQFQSISKDLRNPVWTRSEIRCRKGWRLSIYYIYYIFKLESAVSISRYRYMHHHPDKTNLLFFSILFAWKYKQWKELEYFLPNPSLSSVLVSRSSSNIIISAFYIMQSQLQVNSG